MFSRFLLLGTSMLALLTPVAAQEAQQFEATLRAHAQLPAQSFVTPPEDAPAYFAKSGRFTSGTRVESAYGFTNTASGLSMPFPGQPLQGFSGIRSLGDDRFLVLTDNGFGSRSNSADALLMFNIFEMDWETGRVIVEKTTFLSDPDRVVPFPIVTEATTTRYLTGADFDMESVQPVGDNFWIGDEFGPWVIEVDGSGVVQQVIATEPGDVLHRSPDNPFVSAPVPGATLTGVNTGRSGGYEGMAVSPDGAKLYPLLEKPFFDEEAGALETAGEQTVLRILELSTEVGSWSDTIRYYPLEAPSHAIGDFNMIDENRALVIERDNNEGDARDGRENAAGFKRIYLVDISDLDENNVVRKIAYIDLLDIQDPEGIAPRGSSEGVFTFPFVTIEDVDMVDETTIVVANDNNYPGSTGRVAGQADDNEFILLEVGDFLQAQ